MFVFFFKRKTADEMRMSDWSSDVCSSDLQPDRATFVKGINECLDRQLFRAFNDVVLRLVQIPSGNRIGDDDVFVRSQRDKLVRVKANIPKIGRASCRESVCQSV